MQQPPDSPRLEYSDRPDFCPYCGNPVESENTSGIVGITALVCQHCAETINHRNPFATHIYGATRPFHVWILTPTTERWPNAIQPAVVTDADHPRRTFGDVDISGKPLRYDMLTDVEKGIVTALATNAHVDAITELQPATIDEEIIEALNPFVGTPDTKFDNDTLDAIANRLPRPTMVGADTLYTPNPEQVQAIIDDVSATTTEQATLL